MSGLKEVGSSLRCNEATEKGSTVVDDGVECDGARENALTIDNNGVRCNDEMEKESTVDDDDVESTGLGRSGLGGIGSSLYREGRPRRR